MEFNLTQQFATVEFNRKEDDKECIASVLKGGQFYQVLLFNNDYNPSARRHSSCVYVRNENENEFFKICTIQHKGTTSVKHYPVTHEEIIDLFVPSSVLKPSLED
jgi:hypothetical protein